MKLSEVKKICNRCDPRGLSIAECEKCFKELFYNTKGEDPLEKLDDMEAEQ